MAQELGALAAAIKARKEASAAAAGTDQPKPKPDPPKTPPAVVGLKKAAPAGKDENYYDPKKRSDKEKAEDEDMRRKEMEIRRRNSGSK